MENIELTEECAETREDDAIDYLAEILFESFMEKKGYVAVGWLYGEKRWAKK